jgi:hypothetical protein
LSSPILSFQIFAKKFNRTPRIAIYSQSSSIIEAHGCSLIDSGEACICSISKGIISLVQSTVCQSNKLTPIFKIGKERKLSIENTRIEWNNENQFQTDFLESSFVLFQKVILNKTGQKVFHFEKS